MVEHHGRRSHSGPTRRQVLAGGVGLSCAALLPGCGPEANDGAGAPGTRKPNVLFVLSDAHRASAVGCYGNDQLSTPHMDGLARDGLRLTSAVSSTPQCRPFRASWMSGAYSHHTGVLSNMLASAPSGKNDKTSSRNFGIDARGQWIPGKLPTLGEHFRSQGYRCGYYGKWDLGVPAVDPGPLRRGFDDGWAVWASNKHESFGGRYCLGKAERLGAGKRFRATVETDLALEFMAQDSDRPWLTVVSWGPPHGPLDAPVGYDDRGPVRARPNIPADTQEHVARERLPKYYGLVEAIDHELGRLLRWLEESGQAQDTLVVYTSDHGMMLGSHGLAGKELPYSESICVPFLMRWTGSLPAGASIDMPFGTPDILPTLAGLTGLGQPRDVDGADWSAVLRREPDAPRQEAAYLSAAEALHVGWPGWRGVCTQEHVYACTEDGPWLLFDRARDPYELENLVSAEPQLTSDLHDMTRALMDRLGDRWRA